MNSAVLPILSLTTVRRAGAALALGLFLSLAGCSTPVRQTPPTFDGPTRSAAAPQPTFATQAAAPSHTGPAQTLPAWNLEQSLALADELSADQPGAAALALDEAAVRFPTHSNREAWQWWAAGLDAAAGNSAEAASRYAALLQSAWAGDLPMPGLVDLFTQRRGTPAGLLISASLTPLAAPAGETRGLLVLEADGFRGGACLAVSAGPVGRMVTPLSSRFAPPGSPPRVWVVCQPVDVDGDGLEEILVETGLGGAQLTHEQRFRIISLATSIPQTVRFSPDTSELAPGVGGGSFVGVEDGPGGPMLHFSETPGSRCPIELHRWLAWNGAWLADVAVDLRFNQNLPADAGCLSGLAGRLSSLPPKLVIPQIQALLDRYPAGDAIYAAPGERQEWTLRLAVQLALSGAVEPAQSALHDAASQPDPGLAARAADFLDAYSRSGGVAPACAAEPLCRPDQAVQALLQMSTPDSRAADLDAAGLAGGIDQGWDFENEQQAESVLTLPQSDGDVWDLWVLADWNGQPVALNAGDVLSPRPGLTPYSDLYTPEALQIDELDIVAFRRAPLTGQPYLTRHRSNPQPDLTAIYRAGYTELRVRLFAGDDPAAVRHELDVLQQQPGFVCADFCPGLLYVTALSAELSGDPDSAVTNYQQLIQDHPSDPHALLAQARLPSP